MLTFWKMLCGIMKVYTNNKSCVYMNNLQRNRSLEIFLVIGPKPG
jgi:hypothetical protein